MTQKKPVRKPAAKPAKQADAEAAIQDKIAAMPEHFRSVAARIHAVVVEAAPALEPRLWYGMPAYAKDGKTVCFFRADPKYITFGCTQDANLTVAEGAPHQLMESAWFLTALDKPTETKLADLARKVAS